MISGVKEVEIERAAYFVAGLYPGGMDWRALAGLLAVELVFRTPSPQDDFSTPEKRSQTLVRWCGAIAERWADRNDQYTYTTTEVRNLLEGLSSGKPGEETEALIDLEKALVRVPFWYRTAIQMIASGTSGDIGWGDVPHVIEELTREMNRKEEP